MYSFDALKLSSRAGLRVGMPLGWGMKRVQRLAEDSLCKRTALEARQKRPNRLLCETHIAWRGSVLPAALTWEHVLFMTVIAQHPFRCFRMKEPQS